MAKVDTNKPIHLILVEDDETDFVIFKGMLSRIQQIKFQLEWASSFQKGVELLDRDIPDILLLDYRLGKGANAPTGLDFIKEVNRRELNVPIVVLTGTGSYAIDVQAMELGAVDYIPKHSLSPDLLERSVRYALDRFKAQNDLHSALSQVEKSRQDLLTILNRLRLGTAMIDDQGNVTFLSDVAQYLLDIQIDKILGKPWEVLFEGQSVALNALQKAVAFPSETAFKIPVSREARSGRRYDVEVEVLNDPNGSGQKILFLYDMSELHNLRRTLGHSAQFHGIIGQSDAMQAVFQQIRNVANLDATVLVEGETGTGKELVARAIHFSGRRKEGPFVPVNCAGLSESLVASQLFGHRRGAFTGAVENSQGLFEAAHNGTLFLDEIGDVPSSVQTMLLRALQEKQVVRVGETRQRSVNVRFVAASQHNLQEEVDKGRFRADLLYRIRVARVSLPPLRDRREDIPLMMEQFLDQCRAEIGKDVKTFSDEAKRTLVNYDWPGNVRQLQSAVEAALISCKRETIQIEDLPPEILTSLTASEATPNTSIENSMDEKTRILQALDKAAGNRSLAAKFLGMSRATLYRRLGALDLDTE